jgi:hypothetical protein
MTNPLQSAATTISNFGTGAAQIKGAFTSIQNAEETLRQEDISADTATARVAKENLDSVSKSFLKSAQSWHNI